MVVLAAIIGSPGVSAQPVTVETATRVCRNFLEYRHSDMRLEEVAPLYDQGTLLGYVGHLSPAGFILVSGSRDLRPVTAYSSESRWACGGAEQEIFEQLIKTDLRLRLRQAIPSERNAVEWRQLLAGRMPQNRLEQWPPAGTTPTGGWLFTNWTQSAPYNSMCPIDPNTHQRSYTGCPATAMAQILNCLMEIKSFKLDDADDYYHSYGAGNQYWIDDDWRDHGFPSFDSLNLYLDSAEVNYQWHKPLSTAQIAALNFGCGVALRQVFSASVSGTFGIEQARDAWQRLGFSESRLVYDSDTTLNTDLAENIKNGWPAQLGLVDPDETVGHNVVVDGYNTDEYFHLNFGWGGSSNGWYTMPPTSAPYNLTVIEGIVMDIMADNPHVAVAEMPSAERVGFVLLRNENIIRVSMKNAPAGAQLQIFDLSGQWLKNVEHRRRYDGSGISFDCPELKRGIYILRLISGHTCLGSQKMVY